LDGYIHEIGKSQGRDDESRTSRFAVGVGSGKSWRDACPLPNLERGSHQRVKWNFKIFASFLSLRFWFRDVILFDVS